MHNTTTTTTTAAAAAFLSLSVCHEIAWNREAVLHARPIRNAKDVEMSSTVCLEVTGASTPRLPFPPPQVTKKRGA